MTNFDSNKISVSLQRISQSNPLTISQRGMTPAHNIEGWQIIVINNSGADIDWLNVDLCKWVNTRKKYLDDGGDYFLEKKGWDILTTSFGFIKEGQTLTHFIGDIGNRELCSVYGNQKQSGNFIRWLRTPITPGVTVTRTEIKCFIATAAYQDPDHPMVQQLRFVRDEVFAKTRAGRAFNRFYYRNGPKLAAIVRPRKSLRFASRAVLTPIARTVQASRAVSAASKQAYRYFFGS